MAAPSPQDGYGQYQQAPGYDQGGQPVYEDQSAAPPPGHETADHGRKKKRGYAAQAFEFGAGANAAGAAGQAAPASGQYGMPPPQQAPAYGGFAPADPQLAAQGYPSPQGYGAPQAGAPAAGGVGGYQAPDAYYPGTGAGPAPPAGVAGLSQGMASMQLGPGGQAAGAPQQARPMALNQLYPTDLLNQPFNVSELDLPPPPIVLPPNVRPSVAVPLSFPC